MFTGKRLSDEEVKVWIRRLEKYPKWKLLSIDNYTGGLNNNVFKFLDELRPPPEDPYSELGYDKERKQLPDTSNRAQLERQCGIELMRGIKMIMLSDSIYKGEHKTALACLHELLRGKYPTFKNSLNYNGE
jgi:hypothetical protein